MHQRSGRKHFRWHHCQERIPGVYLRDIHMRQSFCDIRMHALSTTCRRNQYLQMQMSFLYLGSVWSHQIRRWVSKNDGVVEEVVDTTLLVTSNGSLAAAPKCALAWLLREARSLRPNGAILPPGGKHYRAHESEQRKAFQETPLIPFPVHQRGTLCINDIQVWCGHAFTTWFSRSFRPWLD